MANCHCKLPGQLGKLAGRYTHAGKPILFSTAATTDPTRVRATQQPTAAGPVFSAAAWQSSFSLQPAKGWGTRARVRELIEILDKHVKKNWTAAHLRQHHDDALVKEALNFRHMEKWCNDFRPITDVTPEVEEVNPDSQSAVRSQEQARELSYTKYKKYCRLFFPFKSLRRGQKLNTCSLFPLSTSGLIILRNSSKSTFDPF